MTIDDLKIWQIGFNAAFYDKKSSRDNPYEKDTIECQQWYQGWYDGTYIVPNQLARDRGENPHVRVK